MSTRPGGFYRAALDAVDQLELDAAAAQEGLTEEIALTRLAIKAAHHGPGPEDDDVDLINQLMNRLQKLLLAQHRLSGGVGSKFSENLEGVLEGLGELMGAAGP